MKVSVIADILPTRNACLGFGYALGENTREPAMIEIVGDIMINVENRWNCAGTHYYNGRVHVRLYAQIKSRKWVGNKIVYRIKFRKKEWI